MSRQPDAEVIVERLRSLTNSPELTSVFTAFVACVAPDLPSEWRKRTGERAIRRFGTEQRGWLWPLSLLPDVFTAFRRPSVDTLPDLSRFFVIERMLARLFDGRRVDFWRKKLKLLKELPNGLAALAYLAERPRSLRLTTQPRRGVKITKTELILAWHLWDITHRVRRELQDAMAAVKVGPCRHCGALVPTDRRAYCSETCRKAYHNEKSHQRRVGPLQTD